MWDIQAMKTIGILTEFEGGLLRCYNFEHRCEEWISNCKQISKHCLERIKLTS